MPADAHALTGLPADYAGADGVDYADRFMTGHTRILKSWP
jgi:hypothetical protein